MKFYYYYIAGTIVIKFIFVNKVAYFFVSIHIQ